MSAGTLNAAGDSYVSVPRGGPIYLQHTVGRLTRVSDFELSVFDELESLKAEVGWDSTEICYDEICVDDLKIVKEEELVSRAFAEAFKEGQPIANETEIVGRASENGGPENGVLSKNTSEKGKRKMKRPSNNVDLEEGYVEKVQQLARLKQRQDEDKRAARLHSFDGSSRNQSTGSSSQDNRNNRTAIKSTSCSANAKASYASEHVPIQFPEVILCVEVYHNKRTCQKTQEFFVLGQQFLSEIKDKIYCLTDEVMKREGEQDQSGYFLIEDVFCNDNREGCAMDYSQPIFEWLENSRNEALEKWEYIISGEQQPQQKRKAFLDNNETLPLPQFKALDMNKIRFCDIKFRLGAGYLYCHQGDCKHTIIFRDMRLIHPEDVQNRAAYPLITHQLKPRVRKCCVCNIYKATKITVDDKWAKENPCYFCDLCYYILHYADGSLLYSDFSVYDYVHE